MKDIISRRGVPETTVKEWMFGIALIARPDENMLKPLSELLREKYSDAHVTLAISSLTHTFCVQNSDCETNQHAADIIKYVEERTLNAYRSRNATMEKFENVSIT